MNPWDPLTCVSFGYDATGPSETFVDSLEIISGR